MKDTVLYLRGLSPELKRGAKMEAIRRGITLPQFVSVAIKNELDRSAKLARA